MREPTKPYAAVIRCVVRELHGGGVGTARKPRNRGKPVVMGTKLAVIPQRWGPSLR